MKTIYYVLLLALLFIGYLFFSHSPPLKEERPLVEETFYQELTDLTLRLHTLDEEMVLELKSRRFVEYDPQDSSHIYQLEASLYEEDKSLLTFYGDEGEVTAYRDQILVEGPVMIESHRASLTSGYLLYDVDQGLLSGKEGVSYSNEEISITADGFMYDPKKGRIYLEDNVKLLLKKKGG